MSIAATTKAAETRRTPLVVSSPKKSSVVAYERSRPRSELSALLSSMLA